MKDKSKTIRRDEITYVSPNDPRTPMLINICRLAKNLYNTCIYDHRQKFFNHEDRMDSWTAQRVRFAHANNRDYRALPAKVAGEVVKDAGRNFISFFALRKRTKDGTANMPLRVRLPRYLGKGSLHTVTFPKDALVKHPIHRKDGLWEQIICQHDLNLHVITTMKDVALIRIQPSGTGFRIHAIYEKEAPRHEYVPDNGRYASIDLGMDNLMSVFINDANYAPFIVPGGHIKSIQQWWVRSCFLNSLSYHAQHGYKQAEGQPFEDFDDTKPSQDYIPKRLKRIFLKRKHVIDWQAGNITTFIANYLASIRVSHVIIGWNPDWKQNANMSETFLKFPFSRFVNMLEYKLRDLGIRVTRTEESYTSKASFLDHDRIGEHGKHQHLSYSGKRVYRGLYVSSAGVRLNADINGAGNIMRKVIPDELVYSKGVEALVAGPVRHLNLTKQGKCFFS